MKIVVFGGSGQLGFELKKRCLDLHFDVYFPVSKEVNISEQDQVSFLIERLKPDLVINSAAYTLVDHAETEKEKADLTNYFGAKYVAEACAKNSARMIHISTDYVFNGEFDAPISETADTCPINYYGESKLKGERAIQEILGEQGLIVRTSSLHGQKGINFVHTMINLFKDKGAVKVVDDQIMSPTWAGWLAEVLLDLGRLQASGIVHACGKGEVSWYGFAKEIYNIVESEIPNVQISPCTASEFPRPAKRPRYSVMSTARLTKLLGRPAISWQDGLKKHLAELGYKGK